MGNLAGSVIVDTRSGPNLMPVGRFFPADGGAPVAVEGTYALGPTLSWYATAGTGYVPAPVAVVWK